MLVESLAAATTNTALDLYFREELFFLSSVFVRVAVRRTARSL